MNKNIIITAIATLMIGVSAGYFLAPAGKIGSETGAEKVASKERKPIFYRNPMNPSITSPVPAKDEMGMKYIPVYADSETSAGMPAGTVSIDPVTMQNIGVRTATTKRTTLSRVIRSIGRVTFDEQRVARFHSKIDGWIEELFIEKTGDRVKKDTMLLSIYSPQLVASEEEYILALTNAETLKESPFKDIRNSAESLVRSSRERLELLDVPTHQLREIERTRKVIKRLHIHSPFDGTVMKIGAREGQRITPETELYMIADLTKLWVIVDLYEDDMPWVKEGDMAEMRVSGIPGETFKGKVSYIYPYLEAKTRTVKIRLEVDNSGLRLKPEMFANVTLMSNRQLNAITVPSEAIIRTGAREQLFIERAPGKFEPRDVVIGVSANGETQILEGLRVGEKVVTSSQFLIDSESKLKEATSKMLETLQPETETKPAQTNHGAMNHEDMNHSAEKPNQMKHDEMGHGTMNHEGMNHGDMGHGDMQMDHDNMEMNH